MGGTHGAYPISPESVIAGASSDQKLAAIMTPAAKPSEASKMRRWIPFTKNTIAAPRAVTAQVKSVATAACQMG